MGSKEAPKFNPEFGFLENEEIRELQVLIDEIIESPEERENKLALLQEKWDGLSERYKAEAQKDSTNLNQLRDFLSYNMRIISAGGMNLGRSAIRFFIRRKRKTFWYSR